jgi:hypothetical protein
VMIRPDWLRVIVKSIEYFQRAINADPRHARSYAGLADSYLVLDDF